MIWEVNLGVMLKDGHEQLIAPSDYHLLDYRVLGEQSYITAREGVDLVTFKVNQSAINFVNRLERSMSNLRPNQRALLKEIYAIDKEYCPPVIHLRSPTYVDFPHTEAKNSLMEIRLKANATFEDFEILKRLGYIYHEFNIIEGHRVKLLQQGINAVEGANEDPETMPKEQALSELRTNQKEFLRAVYHYLIVKKANSVTFNQQYDSILVEHSGNFDEFEMPQSKAPDETDMHLLIEHGYISRSDTTDEASKA